MRILVLALAASSLVLAGCGKKQATDNTSGLDQAITAQDFDANDATAIDAATGADANMAADVDINAYLNADNGSASSSATRKSRDRTVSNRSETAEPVTEPAEPAPAPAESNAT
ncbi:MAG: hypothetical protein ACJ8D6_04050 [Sphingomicrobium sp.]|jgi:hypothetical protein